MKSDTHIVCSYSNPHVRLQGHDFAYRSTSADYLRCTVLVLFYFRYILLVRNKL